jgi:3-oxoacyl-[acyl-carrier-protein] synthase-1
MSCYLHDLGVVNALGGDADSVLAALLDGRCPLTINHWVPGKTTYVAPVTIPLPQVPETLYPWRSRNLQLALAAVRQLESALTSAVARYGADRVAVIAGTSTSGIDAGEQALAQWVQSGERPADFHYRQQEIGNLAGLLARHLGLSGPAYTLSTACSSSAHALGAARRLLRHNLADAVITGGADSLCRLTLNGFAALESTSDSPVVPFSRNRKGINIGEGAAFFMISRDREDSSAPIELLGVGASSDAHHISAPDPEGKGAEAAIREALHQAGVSPAEVSYVNLHGTGTPLNDAMEAAVIHRLFPHQPPCSSSKGQIGHTLGAAGANEAAICWLLLTRGDGRLAPHLWDGTADERLAPIHLVQPGDHLPQGRRRILLSNSFAFGGNNAAVLLGDSSP